MSKIYPKSVIDQTELLIEGLQETNFFEEYEIEDLTFVRQYLNDLLLQKFYALKSIYFHYIPILIA